MSSASQPQAFPSTLRTDFHDGLDLYADPQRKGVHAHRAPSVLAVFSAEDLHEEVAGAVEDPRLASEPVGAVHEAGDLDQSDLVQVPRGRFCLSGGLFVVRVC